MQNLHPGIPFRTAFVLKYKVQISRIALSQSGLDHHIAEVFSQIRFNIAPIDHLQSLQIKMGDNRRRKIGTRMGL